MRRLIILTLMVILTATLASATATIQSVTVSNSTPSGEDQVTLYCTPNITATFTTEPLNMVSNFVLDPAWTNPTNAYDGDWDTSTASDGANNLIDWNQSFPLNASYNEMNITYKFNESNGGAALELRCKNVSEQYQLIHSEGCSAKNTKIRTDPVPISCRINGTVAFRYVSCGSSGQPTNAFYESNLTWRESPAIEAINYTWYRDPDVYFRAQFPGTQQSGFQVEIPGPSAPQTTKDEIWKFGCTAILGGVESAEVNSTNITIGWDGNGTENNPYLLYDCGDFNQTREFTNFNSTSNRLHLAFNNDINCTGFSNWIPLGSDHGEDARTNYYEGFAGELDGQGYTISDLDTTTGSDIDECNQMFLHLWVGAEVFNFTITDFDQSCLPTNIDDSWSSAYQGLVTGIMSASTYIHDIIITDSEIENTGTGYVGGVVGNVAANSTNPAVIERVHLKNVLIDGDTSQFKTYRVGGIVGLGSNVLINQSAFIGDSTSRCTLCVRGASQTGGAIGVTANSNKVIDTYVSSNVQSNFLSGGGFTNNLQSTDIFSRTFHWGTSNDFVMSGYAGGGGGANDTYNYWTQDYYQQEGTTPSAGINKTYTQMLEQSTYQTYDFTDVWYYGGSIPMLKWQYDLGLCEEPVCNNWSTCSSGTQFCQGVSTDTDLLCGVGWDGNFSYLTQSCVESLPDDLDSVGINAEIITVNSTYQTDYINYIAYGILPAYKEANYSINGTNASIRYNSELGNEETYLFGDCLTQDPLQIQQVVGGISTTLKCHNGSTWRTIDSWTVGSGFFNTEGAILWKSPFPVAKAIVSPLDSLECVYTMNVSYTPEIEWFIEGVQNTSYDDQVTVSSSLTTSGENWTCNVRGQLGGSYTEWFNSTTTYVTQRPSVTNVLITPDPPDTESTLTCNWSFSDPDGDAQNTTWVNWYVDDVLVESENYTGSFPTLSPGFFTSNETIKCSVLGFDGYVNSTDWANYSTSVGNSAPTITSVSLVPNPAKKANTLTCSINGRADVDGDVLTNYYAFYDSDNTTVLQNFSTDNDMDCEFVSGCQKGDNIICKAYTNDGEFNSTILNATATIENTRPRAQSVFIQPFSPVGDTDINCTYTYYDIDGDAEAAVYYKWFLNGTLTGNTSQTLNQTYLNTGDEWRCQAKVYDGTINSTPTNSTLAIINTGNPTNILISDNGTVSEGNSILFTWSWNDPQLPLGGPYRHYLCNSSNITASGCVDTTICEVEDNTSTTNCSFTPSGYGANNTFYLQIYDGLNFSSPIEPHEWQFNRKPTIGAVNLSVVRSANYNTFTCQAINVTDPDGDSTFIEYQFTDSSDTVLQSYSATQTYIINFGAGVTGDNIKCLARATDFTINSDVTTKTDHFRIYDLSYPTSGTVDNFVTIGVTVNNQTTLNGVNISFRSPFNQLFSSVPMTYSNTTNQWEYTFAPNIVGEWAIVSMRTALTGSQSYLLLPSAAAINVVAEDGGGGGGGGGGGSSSTAFEIQELPFLTTDLAGFCGNDVCEEGENPSSCWEDCKVNYDTLITCVFDDNIQCNWNQTWFPVFLLVSLGIIALGSIYYSEVKKKKK